MEKYGKISLLRSLPHSQNDQGGNSEEKPKPKETKHVPKKDRQCFHSPFFQLLVIGAAVALFRWQGEKRPAEAPCIK
jgi:hypothetical protein